MTGFVLTVISVFCAGSQASWLEDSCLSSRCAGDSLRAENVPQRHTLTLAALVRCNHGSAGDQGLYSIETSSRLPLSTVKCWPPHVCCGAFEYVFHIHLTDVFGRLEYTATSTVLCTLWVPHFRLVFLWLAMLLETYIPYIQELVIPFSVGEITPRCPPCLEQCVHCPEELHA